MAIVAYSTFVPEVAPHVQGCPTYVIEQYIAKVVCDLCTRAGIWRADMTDITLVADDYNYLVASSVANTEIVNLLQARLVPSNTDYPKPLEILTDDDLRNRFSQWPDTDNPGEPLYIFRNDEQSVNLSPVPDDADTYTLKLYGTIRPTSTATGWEGTLQQQYRRALFHGVLYELMTIPERTWTNDKFGTYHGKQWTNMVAAARARANLGFGRNSIHVQHKPWA